MRAKGRHYPLRAYCLHITQQLRVFLYCLLSLIFIKKVYKNRTQHRSNSRFFNRFNSSGEMPVHVIKAGCSRLNHLQAGKLRSPVDVLLGQFSFNRPYLLLKPLLELHVIAVAPEQGHGGVRMRINQPGHGGHPLAIDGFIGIL